MINIKTNYITAIKTIEIAGDVNSDIVDTAEVAHATLITTGDGQKFLTFTDENHEQLAELKNLSPYVHDEILDTLVSRGFLSTEEAKEFYEESLAIKRMRGIGR